MTLELFNHKRQSRELAMPDGTLARTHSVGVVTQITATLRLCSGWSGQYSLFDFSCKLSPFRAGLLTIGKEIKRGWMGGLDYSLLIKNLP